MRQNRSSKAKTPEDPTHMDTLLILWYSICTIIIIPVGYGKAKNSRGNLKKNLNEHKPICSNLVQDLVFKCQTKKTDLV